MSVHVSSRDDEQPLASPFRRILITVDGSAAALRAAHVAIEMASVHELPLTALYVIDEKTVGDVAAASGGPVDQVRGQLEEKGWHYLEHVTRMARNHGVDCERLMREGLAHRQIADVVRDLGVDLIVIGRGGHQNSGRGSMGSVTEHVIEYAPCSVLVVKSP